VPNVRRLNDANAGFIDDVSNIIAVEAWKTPGLIPDLSHDATLFMFSDYSSVRGTYKTYSFWLLGRSGVDQFNSARVLVRKKYNVGLRRMSYKGLNDKVKLRALPAFLACAGALEGILCTFAVDGRIRYMFADQFLEAWPELAEIKKSVLEDLLRVVHFGAQARSSIHMNSCTAHRYRYGSTS
jgi:hypothetical protein